MHKGLKVKKFLPFQWHKSALKFQILESESVIQVGFDLLVMDAFLDIFDGVMNDGGQVRRFITKYDQLAAKHGFLVVFNHHAGKRTQQFAPSKDNLLGSQSFEAKMRLVIEVRPDLAIDNRRIL